MNLPFFILLFSSSLAILSAIILAVREHRSKHVLEKQEAMQKQQLSQISILKAIQEKIGYSLDIEHIADTITANIQDIYPCSTASSLIAKEGKLVLKTYVREEVSADFIQAVKNKMLESLKTLVSSGIPEIIEEVLSGLSLNNQNTKKLASYFHLPLTVENRVVGMINIASTQTGLYKDQDMTILYDLVTQASGTSTKLQQMMKTESNKLFTMIVNLADGILMIDSKNTLTMINKTAKKLLNLTSENPTIADVINAFSGTYDFEQNINTAMRENTNKEVKEISLGDTIIDLIISPVTAVGEDTKNHQVIGVSILLHDITLEKYLSKMKEEFTSEIVHELRSPLSAIKAGSELMLTEKNVLDAEQKKKLIEIIFKQSERLLVDIGDLLDAAKLESGHFAIYQKAESVDTLLNDSVELFRSEAQKKHIAISLDLEPNLPKGFFDQVRISQVVNNLISNSLKYTPEGGKISVTANTSLQDHLPQTTTNPGILICVSDTGIGIAPDKQTTLFSKFARLENVGFVHSKEGTGLGLYITKAIVEAHGGNIFLKSEPGKGTTVSFTLPIAQGVNAETSSKVVSNP